jgi:glucan phosphoethanolaminetransferase (alkaline phosphatase superfamily)
MVFISFIGFIIVTKILTYLLIPYLGSKELIVGIWADCGIVHLFFLIFLIFKNRFLYILFLVVAPIAVWINFFTLVIYWQTKSMITPYFIRLLAENINYSSLSAYLSDFRVYMLTLLFMVPAILAIYGFFKFRGLLRRPSLWVLTPLFIFAMIGSWFQTAPRSTAQLNDFFYYSTCRPVAYPAFKIVYDVLYDLYSSKNEDNDENIRGILLDEKESQICSDLGLVPKQEKQRSVPASFTRRSFDKIVIIALESIDRDYIRYYNPNMPKNIMPFLNSLLERYPHFDNFYTSSLPSDNGMHAIINSRLDFHYDADRHFTGINSLFSILARHGYSTWLVEPTSKNYSNHIEEFDRVFRSKTVVYGEDISLALGKQFSGWGHEDKTLYDFTLTKLSKNTKSIFIIHTIGTHPPYDAITPTVPKDDPIMKVPFLTALRACDDALKFFLTELSDRKLLSPRTLIVITSDHSATHGANYTARQDYSPDRLPLIFITENAKDLFSPINSRLICSQIDLAPTLLDILGYPSPLTFMGRTMFLNNNTSVSLFLAKESLIVHYMSRDRNPTELVVPLTKESNFQEERSSSLSAIRKWYGTYRE